LEILGIAIDIQSIDISSDEISKDVISGEIWIERRSIHISTDDCSGSVCVIVSEEGCGQSSHIAIGSVYAEISFHDGVSIVQSGSNDVDFFLGIDSNVSEVEVSSSTVEGEFPWVSESISPDFGEIVGIVDEWVAHGDRITSISVQIVDVDSEDLSVEIECAESVFGHIETVDSSRDVERTVPEG
jgi:hypothetical protein